MWMEILGTIIIAAVTAALGFLTKWIKQKADHDSSDWIDDQLVTLTENAIAKVNDDYVHWWKDASTDGKLTSEERKQALEIAYNNLLYSVKDEAVRKKLLDMGVNAAYGLIAKVVQKGKASNVEVVTGGIDNGGDGSNTEAVQENDEGTDL